MTEERKKKRKISSKRRRKAKEPCGALAWHGYVPSRRCLSFLTRRQGHSEQGVPFLCPKLLQQEELPVFAFRRGKSKILGRKRSEESERRGGRRRAATCRQATGDRKTSCTQATYRTTTEIYQQRGSSWIPNEPRR